VADDSFWNRMETISEYDDGAKSGSHRIEFWFATIAILKDYPAGLGIRGYNVLVADYIDSKWSEKRRATKSMHSTWFQSLAEMGYPGPILLVCLLIVSFRMTWRIKKSFESETSSYNYFLIVAIEGAFLTFIVAMSFIDRMRAEELYWFILFVSSAYSLFYLKQIKNPKALPPISK
jgi:O-antigen ligase